MRLARTVVARGVRWFAPFAWFASFSLVCLAVPAAARKPVKAQKRERPKPEVAAAAPSPAAKPPPQATARDWVAKYLAATGDEAAREMTSRSCAGTVERLPSEPGSTSRTWKLELAWKAPAKAREAWSDAEGKTRRVFDGEHGGWIAGPGIRRQRLRQLERVELVRLAALFQPLVILPLDELVVDRRDRVGDREAVVLKLKNGEAVWLDVTTGLPLRLDLLADRPELDRAGDFYLSQVFFDDWRQVGSVQIPHRLRRVLSDQTITWRFTEVQQGLDLPDRLFKKPYFWRR